MAPRELMMRSASVRQSRQSEGWRGLWSRGLTSRSHHGSTFACDVEWRKGRTFTIHQSNTADTGQEPSDLVKQSPPSWDCWRSTMRVLHFLCPCTATSSVCSLCCYNRLDLCLLLRSHSSPVFWAWTRVEVMGFGDFMLTESGCAPTDD